MQKTISKKLIGTITSAKTKTNETTGKIIDETKNTIKIMTTKGIKTIPKKQLTLIINKQQIDGKKTIGRIENRIKNSQN